MYSSTRALCARISALALQPVRDWNFDPTWREVQGYSEYARGHNSNTEAWKDCLFELKLLFKELYWYQNEKILQCRHPGQGRSVLRKTLHAIDEKMAETRKKLERQLEYASMLELDDQYREITRMFPHSDWSKNDLTPRSFTFTTF